VNTSLDLSAVTLAIARDGSASALATTRPPPRVDGHSLGIAVMSQAPPHAGERHLDGDEVLLLIAGRCELLLERGGDPHRIALEPMRACIVPRGLWHRVVPHGEITLLYLTPEHDRRAAVVADSAQQVGLTLPAIALQLDLLAAGLAEQRCDCVSFSGSPFFLRHSLERLDDALRRIESHAKREAERRTVRLARRLFLRARRRCDERCSCDRRGPHPGSASSPARMRTRPRYASRALRPS